VPHFLPGTRTDDQYSSGEYSACLIGFFFVTDRDPARACLPAFWLHIRPDRLTRIRAMRWREGPNQPACKADLDPR
jgi:hypothetical protein